MARLTIVVFHASKTAIDGPVACCATINNVLCGLCEGNVD